MCPRVGGGGGAVAFFEALDEVGLAAKGQAVCDLAVGHSGGEQRQSGGQLLLLDVAADGLAGFLAEQVGQAAFGQAHLPGQCPDGQPVVQVDMDIVDACLDLRGKGVFFF